MRIATSMIYDTTVYNTNESLTRMMKLSEQKASMKRVNKPSDIPGNVPLILDLNSELARLGQYDENIATASAWLGLADSTLTQVSTAVTSAKELAEQAATGTISDEQRRIIARKARQLFDSMINLANTRHNGYSIFGGHKTTISAYDTALAADLCDSSLPDNLIERVNGVSTKSIGISFTSSGTIGTDAIPYKFTLDGGKTWTTKTLAAGSNKLDLGGASVDLKNGAAVTTSASEKLAFVVRPAAIYNGDDNDGATVSKSGSSPVTALSTGAYASPVTVRIDKASDLTSSIDYSFSLDGGNTWVTGNTANGAGDPSGASLPVPGGFLKLASNAGNTLAKGDQFTITPNSASITLDIGPQAKIAINSVGKDIFGGWYIRPGDSDPSLANADNSNLFEALGELVGALETNDQTNISNALEKLNAAHKHITSVTGEIGARENRVSAMQTAVANHKDRVQRHKSALEDADLTKLVAELERENVVYTAIAKSSAKIMQLSLLDYV